MAKILSRQIVIWFPVCYKAKLIKYLDFYLKANYLNSKMSQYGSPNLEENRKILGKNTINRVFVSNAIYVDFFKKIVIGRFE